jgi:tetratricopeptide (TPR) repeat protein
MRSLTTEVWLVLGLAGAACATAQPAPNPIGDRELQACARYLEQREVDRAETACTICLKYYPERPECLNNLGLVWYLRGVDDKARDFFQRAVHSNPDFVPPYNNLGRLAFDRGDHDKARRLFAAAVRMDPNFIDALYNLALNDLRHGQQRFAEQSGRPPGARSWDAALVNLADSERGYRELLELHPADVRGFADLGVIESLRAEMATTEQQRRTALERAETWYLGCLQRAADHVECHGNLAQLYFGSGRCREAVPHLARCLELDPANLFCRETLAPASSCAQAQEAAKF